MMDFVDGFEARNYGIRRETTSRYLSELQWITLSLLAIAAVLFFYAWVRSQIIEVGYDGQQLRTIEDSLIRTRNNLILEEETLKNPERIDSIARNELGMMPLRPAQIIPPQFDNLDLRRSAALALAEPPEPAPAERKPSATN